MQARQPHRRRSLWRISLLLAALPLPGAGREGGSLERADELHWLRWPGAFEGRARLAPGPRPGELWVGDAHGLVLRDAAGGVVRKALGSPVHALVAAPGGAPAWLVATETGLYRIDAEAQLRRVQGAAGLAQQPVYRLAVAPGLVAAAGETGLFVSSDAEAWRTLDGALPVGAVDRVALGPLPNGETAILLRAGERVLRGALRRATTGWQLAALQRAELAPEAGAEPELELHFDAQGRALVVHPEWIASADSGAAQWQRMLPVLAPQTRMRDLVSLLGDWWLLSDRGLFRAVSVEGPWQSVPAPFAAGIVSDLCLLGERLHAAAAGALWVADLAPAQPRVARTRALLEPGTCPDPPIGELQRVALRRLDFDGRREAAMWRGVRRRAWLPLVTLRGAYESERDHSTDWDESFVSGQYHDLVDRGRGKAHGYDVDLALTWDLRELAYHSEQIDISAESRQRLRLRDEVLDEINQFYFERQRLLGELAAQPDPASEDALSLRFRAGELAAGLDAWTDGWFSRACVSGSAHPAEAPAWSGRGR